MGMQELNSGYYVERSLSSILKQIQPSPEFVRKLQSRLSTQPSITMERRSSAMAFIVVVFSVFLGAVLLRLFWRTRRGLS